MLSGAPYGNRNAWKHGARSGRTLAQDKGLRDLYRAYRAALDEF